MPLVTVTQKDVDKGKQGSLSANPVALAIARVRVGSKFFVGTTHVRWLEDNELKQMLLPAEVQRWLSDFHNYGRTEQLMGNLPKLDLTPDPDAHSRP